MVTVGGACDSSSECGSDLVDAFACMTALASTWGVDEYGDSNNWAVVRPVDSFTDEFDLAEWSVVAIE